MMPSERSGFIFRRPELARQIADGLTGGGLTDYRSGLFLAGPRRTGKSTFLREDLIPECESRGWYPVYVDLWADRKADPADLISTAIADELTRLEGRIRKLIKSSGVDKLSIFRTFSWDFSKPKLPEEVTLSQALEALHEAADKLVVLIIDEAQHAQTTDTGLNAMFALKSARDHLTQGRDKDALRLVFTGSNRDKLAHLVLKKDQPFFGSSVTSFPFLGTDYVHAFTEWVNGKLAVGNQFSLQDMQDVFEMVGHRPEMLLKVVSEVSLNLGEAAHLGDLLRDGALYLRDGVWGEFESGYLSLTDLQKAVLEVMIDRASSREPFSPFTEATIQEVGRVLGELGSDSQAGVPAVQGAMDALREKDLIWRSSRGVYALEDQSIVDWFKHYRKSSRN